MPLPTSQNLFDLSYPFKGSPFVQVSGKTVDTYDLSFPFKASPLIVASADRSVTFTEYLALIDGASGDLVGGESISPILDSITTSRSITFNEYIYLTDSGGADTETDIEVLGSVVLQVKSSHDFNGSVKMEVLAPADPLGSITNVVLADNLVPVTNATSVDNPTETTLILGGQTVYSFPSTLPPTGLSNARCYVNYLCNALFSDKSLSDFFNWSININGGEGTWRTASTTDFSTLGDQLEIFGLSCTLTQKGREKSTGTYAYTNGGILGTSLLNKPVAFNYAGSTTYTTMLQNQSLQLPDPANWKTYADATRQIASAANVSVNWAIPDYPLSDISFQSGMTSIEALTALAEGVGGKLRPSGGGEYVVLFPNKPTGTYQVPDCCLIQAMSHTCYLDIKTGIYNPGVYVFPQYPIIDAGVAEQTTPGDTINQSPNGSFERNVEVLFTSSKLVTPQDPAFNLDLPFDFEDVFIKIVTVTDGGGVWVTTNPKKWFLLQTGFAGQYINYNDILGQLQPQVTVDWTLFPQTNTDVLNGNFIFMIGFSRKSLSGSLNNNQGTTNQEIKQNLARTWLKYRFIPTCQYNVTAIFSGALPLPGMALKAQIGDYIIGANNDVIIESVAFNNPGILNITAIQWSEIQYYDYFRNLS